MNIIVNRPQLVRAVLLYLNKSFGNLTQKTSSKYPDSVFYVNSNNEILMKYDKKTEYVWINYLKIWSKIESLFPLNYSEIQSIMKHWLEETYKLKGVTPHSHKHLLTFKLEETYKLKGVTPCTIGTSLQIRLEETYKLKGVTPDTISVGKPSVFEETYKLKGVTPDSLNLRRYVELEETYKLNRK